jgi:hypothetical protein
MQALQLWLFRMLAGMKWATPFMTSKWGWPFCETVHFLGLSLLMGTIGMFDLRMLGMGKRVPLGALHKLVPWGVGGYVLALLTGIMFLATEPDQYLFNSAFHGKVLFMGLAGLNAGAFYLGVFRRARRLGPGEDAEPAAKVIAALSLFLWTGVIVFGRMLTFYRPADCDAAHITSLLSCIPVR